MRSQLKCHTLNGFFLDCSIQKSPNVITICDSLPYYLLYFLHRTYHFIISGLGLSCSLKSNSAFMFFTVLKQFLIICRMMPEIFAMVYKPLIIWPYLSPSCHFMLTTTFLYLLLSLYAAIKVPTYPIAKNSVHLFNLISLIHKAGTQEGAQNGGDNLFLNLF